MLRMDVTPCVGCVNLWGGVQPPPFAGAEDGAPGADNRFLTPDTSVEDKRARLGLHFVSGVSEH